MNEKISRNKQLVRDTHIPCPDHIDRETGLPKKVIVEMFEYFSIDTSVYNNEPNVQIIYGTKGNE